MEHRLEELGYDVIEGVYTPEQVRDILTLIDKQGFTNAYGIRAFLIGQNELVEKLFTPRLKDIIRSISPTCNTLIKSIYFDKPPSANWIVNWHQDLTINVTGRREVEGYINWRELPDRTVVQPNRTLLENIFTIRIHLDHCTSENGALKVIEKSHKHGVIAIEEWKQDKPGTERICEVPLGGIQLMKPLTLHSSYRTENNQHRRVIHLEFTDQELPEGLEWNEAIRFES
jgi:hypothetical protein